MSAEVIWQVLIVHRTVPPELQQFVARCLAADPEAVVQQPAVAYETAVVRVSSYEAGLDIERRARKELPIGEKEELLINISALVAERDAPERPALTDGGRVC